MQTETEATAIDLDLEAILSEAGIEAADLDAEHLATAMRAIAW